MAEHSSPKSESTECRVADFDYDLPAELIAQQPPAERGMSRMLVMDRRTGALRDDFFSDFRANLRRGDLLVLNDSRVIPARLYARRTLRRDHEKPTGRIEVMLLEPAGENQWRALVRPGRKVAIGERLVFPARTGEIGARSGSAGARKVRRTAAGICSPVGRFLCRAGRDRPHAAAALYPPR